VLKQVCI